MSTKKKMITLEGNVPQSLKKQFKTYCKKNNTNQSEAIRNAIQALVKRK
ncbi:ribbon-helix-helix domain-containing protein [Flavitalea antarctica]